jgi:oligoendopeptidase F
LSDLYADVDDPKIDEHLTAFVRGAEAFHQKHKGNLARTLGEALREQATLSSLASQLMAYLQLRRSTDATNLRIQQRIGQVHEAWSRADADYLNFFEHELVALDDETYARILAEDAEVRRHRPLLDHWRANRQYLLHEDVERALVLRSPFGPSEWTDFLDEQEAELSFELGDETLNLPRVLHVISNDPSRERRAAALAAFSKGLEAQRFDKLMARTLNVVIGAKAVEDRERGYANPMSSRNISNRVDDDTVHALHRAVVLEGAKQARRYYRLLAAHLGLEKLAWSDRNASLPSVERRVVPWTECVDTVLSAYSSFSPVLRDCVKTMFDRKWVDAPPYAGKTGGAYNYSLLLPSGEARAYNFLNYQGSPRDVMTVAHEAGHGAHGMLAAEAQGALMFRAPMAYAETASIFGEMTTFRYLLERADSDTQRLGLLMEKCSDHVNTVVRQISFSYFEQKVHERRREARLTPQELSEIWLGVTQEFYGPEGDLFTYESAHNLWAYVTHFLRPFYVYAYAFGELFTQSLFAVQDRFGTDFEPMYLDLLKAGGTKSAVELMQPFGLDPRDPTYWVSGIQGSIGRWLDQAEAISAKLGVAVIRDRS